MNLYNAFDLSPESNREAAYAKFMLAPLKNTVFEISITHVDFGNKQTRPAGLLVGHNQTIEVTDAFALPSWLLPGARVDCEKTLMELLVSPRFCFKTLKTLAVFLEKGDNPGFSVEQYFDLLEGKVSTNCLVTKPPVL